MLAENENKVDLLAGVLPDAGEPAVVNILVDLMRREMRRQSFIAAQAIVAQLKPSIRVRRFPLRRLTFCVAIARCPFRSGGIGLFVQQFGFTEFDPHRNGANGCRKLLHGALFRFLMAPVSMIRKN